MRKNEYTKKYDITIIGGGLTGKLMLSFLQKTHCRPGVATLSSHMIHIDGGLD